MSNPPPIVVRPKPLDVLADMMNQRRKIHKEREASRDFHGLADWEREGRRRFGPNKARWRWRCHVCDAAYDAGYAVMEGMAQSQIGFDCIGTVVESHPCNHSGSQPPHNPIAVRLPGGVTARMLCFAD